MLGLGIWDWCFVRFWLGLGVCLVLVGGVGGRSGVCSEFEFVVFWIFESFEKLFWEFNRKVFLGVSFLIVKGNVCG